MYRWHLFTGAPALGAPHVELKASSIGGSVPLEVRFAESVVLGEPATLAKRTWTFGDGATSADQDPSHLYTKPGNYQAALTITDSEGRSTTRQLTIAVPGPETTLPAVQPSAAGWS